MTPGCPDKPRAVAIAIAACAFGVAVAATPAAAQELSGFVQIDYLHSQQSADEVADGDGEPLNQDRLLVRRGRVRIAGTARVLEYAAEIDLNTVEGMTVGLRETYVGVAVPAPARWGLGVPVTGRVTAGILRAPFGYETYAQRDVDRLFAERALVSRALFPGELDLTAQASVDACFGALAVAVVNGEPIGSQAFAATDPNAAKDVIGRATLLGALGPVRLSAGVSVAWGRGFHPGTAPTKDTLVWRDLNEDGIVQLGELTAIPGSAGTPSETFARWGAEIDGQLAVDLPRVGTLRVYGEAALASNLDRGLRPADPVLLGRDQRSTGGYVAVVQHVGELAAAGVRVDYYQPEIDDTDLQGGQIVRSRERFVSVSAAASAQLTVARTRGRVVLDYTHNRDPLGRDSAGRPADLANDTVVVRAETVF